MLHWRDIRYIRRLAIVACGKRIEFHPIKELEEKTKNEVKVQEKSSTNAFGKRA